MTQSNPSPRPDHPPAPGAEAPAPPAVAPELGLDPAASLGHSLKNSLYAIMLQAECAQSSAAQGDAKGAGQAMGRVRDAAQEAADQVDELLRLVRNNR